jgi:hypothetical protein
MFGFFNKSVIVYLLILAIFVLACSYFWRKMWNMEISSKIMERKISNLKKENSELQYALNNTATEVAPDIDDAVDIMDSIFNFTDKKECADNKCFVEEIHTDVSEMKESVSDVDIGTDVIENKKEPETVVSEQISGEYSRTKLNKMNLEKLKEISSAMNLPLEGTKNILIERILTQ